MVYSYITIISLSLTGYQYSLLKFTHLMPRYLAAFGAVFPSSFQSWCSQVSEHLLN